VEDRRRDDHRERSSHRPAPERTRG
jgi:hypothetical protein